MLGRLAALAELEETRNVGVQALADLAAASEEVTLKAGDTLFKVGDSHSHLILVTAGTVEAARREPDLVRRYEPTALVGGAAALCERIKLWGARATTAARVVAVPAEAWLDMVEEHAELTDSVMSALARLRAELLDRLAKTAGTAGARSYIDEPTFAGIPPPGATRRTTLQENLTSDGPRNMDEPGRSKIPASSARRSSAS